MIQQEQKATRSASDGLNDDSIDLERLSIQDDVSDAKVSQRSTNTKVSQGRQQISIGSCSKKIAGLLKPGVACDVTRIEIKQGLSDEIASALSLGLASFKSLKSLTIESPERLRIVSDAENWAKVAIGLESCTSTLEELKIVNDNTCYGNVTDGIIQTALQSPNLRALHLYGTVIEHSGMTSIAATCRKSDHFESLHIEFCNVDPDCLFELAKGLSESKSLKSLKAKQMVHPSGKCYSNDQMIAIYRAIGSAMAGSNGKPGNNILHNVELGVIITHQLESFDFHIALNSARFQGTYGDGMTSKQWIKSLLSLRKEFSYRDNWSACVIEGVASHELSLLYYFLRYRPDWWCAVSTPDP